MTESPIFVVGAPRSGTGLVRDLLRSHPNLAFAGETHFVPLFYRAYGDPADERAARTVARRMLRHPRVRAWDLELEPASFSHCRSFAGLLSVLYGAMAAREGKPRWGDKTPQYVAHVPALLELFPLAKILHVHRDARDVVLSTLRVRFGPTNVYAAAKQWRRLVRAGREAGGRRPGSYLELSYEALLADPEDVMRRVCAFVGEPFTEAVLRPTYLARAYQGHWLGGSPPGPASRTEIVPENAAKWRSSLTRSERSVVESVAGDLLAELGYELEGLAHRIPRRRQLFFEHADAARRALQWLDRRGKSPSALVLVQEARARALLRELREKRPAGDRAAP
jgi:hypothetical protein